MSLKQTSIPKHPVLKPAEDFYRLRREGIGFIEQMGSRLWTDYNTHDPGITLLEAFCYAITDLAYRAGWDIKDIMAPESPGNPENPFPQQSFFTAAQILTVNPWTPDDFRRLLIDLDLVRNAWLFCKECACDVHYYAWCEEDELHLAFQKPSKPNLQPVKVSPSGLYEVLLELENDPELGDLNDRKIERTLIKTDPANKNHPIVLELRFPDWGLANEVALQQFLENIDAFEILNGASFALSIQLGAIKGYDVLTDATLDSDGKNNYLHRHWRNVLYISFDIAVEPGGPTIHIAHAALRLLSDSFAKDNTTLADLEAWLTDTSNQGFIRRYRSKLIAVKKAIAQAREALHAHRNLDEDYCRIKGVAVQEVSVCADVEVAPDADIERIQAEIWFAIEQHFNPPVPFYSLQELLDEDMPVENIFNGPALNNGFIKAEELAAAQLKPVLRTSDLINLLMDIDGVIAVNNLLLSKYDAEGKLIKGAADPVWNNGMPIFDPNKSSAAWLLYMNEQHQPRLYHNQSRFLFYKNGLPFLPRTDEVKDTLVQLRGISERPRIKNAINDLRIPLGAFRNVTDYFPVQYSLPLTYGTGQEGLPSNASPLRRAQAKQLKAYLLVFEQIMANSLAQVAHTADLFSLDPDAKQTHFTQQLNESIIQGYDELASTLTADLLKEITETLPNFQKRRNRFLDHLLARFGENFGEYALMVNNLYGMQNSQDRLIKDKISFIKAYPQISHDRGKAFNYTRDHCLLGNIPGIKKRVSLLLGFPDLHFEWGFSGSNIVSFALTDSSNKIWLEGNPAITASDPVEAQKAALKKLMTQLVRSDAYVILLESGKYRLSLLDADGNPLGQRPDLLITLREAEELRSELVAWSSQERAILVEHLLLRPKFPGDALYPACSDGGCNTCGNEDPYSFRLTFVMPGWMPPFNTNLDMRRFADRTIKQETPSHLLGKICWVGNDGFIANLCDPVIDKLGELLQNNGVTTTGEAPTGAEACDCATTLYNGFSVVFANWYTDKTLLFLHPDGIKSQLETEFNHPDLIDTACTTDLAPLWIEIRDIMLEHFIQVALYGWQFERFEDAWCKWLEANGAFDWTEERLQESVEAILTEGLITTGNSKVPTAEELCKCAAGILQQYGIHYFEWMEENIRAGNDLVHFSTLVPPPVVVCAGFSFQLETESRIADLLENRYTAYIEVSYRLRVLLNLLSKLRNTWPGATLHDCDDGSDQNPVRLGSTALGNYPLQRSLVQPASRTSPSLIDPEVVERGAVIPEEMTHPSAFDTPGSRKSPKKVPAKRTNSRKIKQQDTPDEPKPNKSKKPPKKS